MKEKGLNDRQIFVNLKKKWKTKAHQEKKKKNKSVILADGSTADCYQCRNCGEARAKNDVHDEKD
uniref:Uncharacterized protein n=1 Tax=Romanomermis culicivorax TaxID=13658 RepID=A0A915JFS2_ROMCU